MGPKNKVSGLIVFGLFALTLSFCATGTAQPPPPTPDRKKCDSKLHGHDIDVRADAVGCKLAFMHMTDDITWNVAGSTTKKLKIVFVDSTVFSMVCDGSTSSCKSGVPKKAGGLDYLFRYTASLCDDPQHCTEVEDPGIIINP